MGWVQVSLLISLVIPFITFCLILTQFLLPTVQSVGIGCVLEQNVSCPGACQNKLWYDCSEYLGGQGCHVSYCVRCVDGIYKQDAQGCPFLFAEKESCPIRCVHEVDENKNDPLSDDRYEDDQEAELF